MKLNIVLAALLSLALGQVAVAKEKRVKKTTTETSDNYTVPWGMAGCSIWNYVIKDKDQGPQLGVWALEHLVFGVQTFAITSGTSNCVQDPQDVAMNKEQEVFVTVNLSDLQKEAAQGKGRHLDTLAEIFGCGDREAFAHLSQNRYEAIFSNENPSNVVQSYKSEIKSSNATCQRAG